MDDVEREQFRRGPGQPPVKLDDPKIEWQELRDLALTVACPECHVPKDVACVNRKGGLKPAVLKRAPAHPARITLARRMAAS